MLKGNLTRDRLSFFVLILCSLSVLFLSALILASWGKLPPQLPIFYSRPWGEPMLATPLHLWILPAISLLVVVLNFFLANFFSELRFISRMLAVFALLTCGMIAYTGTKIISLLL